MQKTLLPTGCYDLLPPIARQESALSAGLLSVFESFGYEQVSPPLLEYSDGLLSGRGAALSPQMFRVMDPGAHKVMGIRPDMTLQVARIAAGRLVHAPRPLRLCYNGPILRMQAEQLKTERQLLQAGIELIGPASPDADAEVIRVAAGALKSVGVNGLCIDLNLPGIAHALLAGEALDNDRLQALLSAVAHKDLSAVRGFSLRYRDTLLALMQCAGPAADALAAMERMALPDSARAQCRALQDVVNLLARNGDPDWTLTVDPTEHRGLAYHSGIDFSIFAPGAACEVGRGGRYRIENGVHGEEATGFTLYVETLRELLPEPERGRRILVPQGTDSAYLRAEGYITVHALSEYGDGEEEARRLGCGYVYKGSKVLPVKEREKQ